MKTSILLCIALISTSSVALANGGTVRFTGSVADPVCHASLPTASFEISLDNCPVSAKGAQVQTVALNRNGAKRPQQFALAATNMSPGDLSFSESHRMGATDKEPLSGAYIVEIDYP